MKAGPAADDHRAVEADQDTLFRRAMASFPSGVTIVTTSDAHGRWRGFTATAFSMVSHDPRLILVCLSQRAECHPAFIAAARWNVHVIPREHADLARRFATRGANKFDQTAFCLDMHGVPRLDSACATLSCISHASHPAGDHTILIGRVERTHLATHPPAIYYRHDFHSVSVSQ